jgi:serine/threonine protein kinase/tetratricopeptide (TPR) repeat protein
VEGSDEGRVIAPAAAELQQRLADALVDRYTIEREIGSGAAGCVFLAEDRKHGRKVAIKVLAPSVTSSLGAERLTREIAIVARLSHPHVVPLIDSGTAGGLLYHVAPYVSGGSLRDRLDREKQLSVTDTQRIAEEVGSGLDFVHRSGFIHRDVKPSNILFADGLALLGDFGIANAYAGGMEQITSEGVAVGTPAYMSPEQASGESHLDRRSDIYSLACLVYEMLTGEPPFRAPNARALMAKQITEAPRPLRAVRPDVGRAIEWAVAKALSKDPAHRFASVPEFTVALRQGEGRDEGRVHPLHSRSIAVLPFVNASVDAENEYLSDGITDELINALAKVGGLHVASRTSVFALKGTSRDVRALGALLGVSEVIEGSIRKAGPRLRITAQLTSTDDGRLLWSNRYDRTLEDVFAMQDEIAQTIVNTLRATFLADLATPGVQRRTANVAAYGLYLRGRHAWNTRTGRGVVEAIHYFEQAIAEDPGYAAAYSGLADSYALQVDYRDVPVEEGFARAEEYARKAIALDEGLADAHASLAWCLFIYDWNWGDAERAFRRAIELNPQYAPAHQWYTFLLISQRRFDEALVEAHTAIELEPASVSVRRSAGWAYYYARRFDRAVEHLDRAIALDPTAEETYRVLALALAQHGDLKEAERVGQDALTLPGSGTYTRATLGYVLARSGRRAEAEAILAELDEQATRGYVSPVGIARVSAGLGLWDRVLECIERALADRRGWLAYLTVDPMLDPLHSDPRFVALVRRMRLPEASRAV